MRSLWKWLIVGVLIAVFLACVGVGAMMYLLGTDISRVGSFGLSPPIGERVPSGVYSGPVYVSLSGNPLTEWNDTYPLEQGTYYNFTTSDYVYTWQYFWGAVAYVTWTVSFSNGSSVYLSENPLNLSLYNTSRVYISVYVSGYVGEQD